MAAPYQKLNDEAIVKSFEEKVKAIGEITTETAKAINEAQAFFDNLTEAQKDLAKEVKKILDQKAAALDKLLNEPSFDIKYDENANKKFENEFGKDGLVIDANKTKGLVLYAKDANFDKFVSVNVDGKTLDKKYYKIEKGSIKLTLTSEYLKTLKSGTHKLRLNTTAGFGEFSFNVRAQNPGQAVPPANNGKAATQSGKVKENDNAAVIKQVKNEGSINTGDGIEFIIYTISLIGACAAISAMLKRRAR